MSQCIQILAFFFLNIEPPGELRWLFCGRVSQLLLTWENRNGNYIDRSSRCVLAGRWRLGIFPLAQGRLAPPWRREKRGNRESLTLKRAIGARDVRSMFFL